MTKLTLYLEPAAQKFFAYHHDDVVGKPSHLREPFRQLVISLCQPHPTGVIKPIEGMVKVETTIGSRNKRYNLDSRSSAIWIPECNMRLLNDSLISLLEHEINITVDLYLVNGKRIKDAFDFIIDKYDLDATNDYSIDRMKKMNYRHRVGSV